MYIMIKQLRTSYVVLPYTDVCEEAKGNGRERCSRDAVMNSSTYVLGTAHGTPSQGGTWGEATT